MSYMKGYKMRNLITEYRKDFPITGYKATIRVEISFNIENAYRCGYVSIIDADNWLVNKLYASCDANFHGGITYDKNNKFGFDCSHYSDIPDVESAIGHGLDKHSVEAKRMADKHSWMADKHGYEVRSLEYVKKVILETLKDFKSNI